MDITGIMLAAVSFMFLLSGPSGRNKYWPLVFGIILCSLGVFYGVVNKQTLFYPLAVAVLVKGFWMYRKWES